MTQTAQLLTVQFEIEAKPTPSISWFRDAKELSELGDRFVHRVERKAGDVFNLVLEIKVTSLT